jgi:hypothetical protein
MGEWVYLLGKKPIILRGELVMIHNN